MNKTVRFPFYDHIYYTGSSAASFMKQNYNPLSPKEAFVITLCLPAKILLFKFLVFFFCNEQNFAVVELSINERLLNLQEGSHVAYNA